MAEWLILLLVVPAIVVPAVLLLGFAGCVPQPPFHGRPPAPVIVSVFGTSDSSITLTWTYESAGLDHIQFERTRLPDPRMPPPSPGDPEYLPVNFDTTSSSHADTGLQAGTTYEYRARAVLGDGATSDLSAPVSGTTLPGFAILAITQNDNFGNVNTNTVKCEIAAADLMAPPFTPTRMWITLGQWADAGEDITFSKVFVGKKTAPGDAWDAASLTPVLFGGAESTVVTPMGQPSRSDEIAFEWDGTPTLILSMYFAGGMLSDLLSALTGTQSNTHHKTAVDEAAVANATGYATIPGYVSGVVRIEVA